MDYGFRKLTQNRWHIRHMRMRSITIFPDDTAWPSYLTLYEKKNQTTHPQNKCLTRPHDCMDRKWRYPTSY